jgi:excisionase family DNA binding protein
MPDESEGPLLPWITTSEAAELTGYAQGYIRQLIQKDKLHAVKRGGVWFLKREDVMAYAEQMEELGSGKHDPWRSGARKRKDDETSET